MDDNDDASVAEKDDAEAEADGISGPPAGVDKPGGGGGRGFFPSIISDCFFSSTERD